MDEFFWSLMTIVGPLILLGILLWLAFSYWSRRSPRSDTTAERATHDLYEEEERRRREGTDDL